MNINARAGLHYAAFVALKPNPMSAREAAYLPKELSNAKFKVTHHLGCGGLLEYPLNYTPGKARRALLHR